MANDYLSLTELKANSNIIAQAQDLNPTSASDSMLEFALTLSGVWIRNYGELDSSTTDFTEDMAVVAQLMAEKYWIERQPELRAAMNLPIKQLSSGDISYTIDYNNPSAVEAFCRRIMDSHTKAGQGSVTFKGIETGLSSARLVDNVDFISVTLGDLD